MLQNDFTLSDHGSVQVLTPNTDEAESWVVEYLPEDAQTWGNGIVIEPRYVEAVLDGLMNSGLTVEGFGI